MSIYCERAYQRFLLQHSHRPPDHRAVVVDTDADLLHNRNDTEASIYLNFRIPEVGTVIYYILVMPH